MSRILGDWSVTVVQRGPVLKQELKMVDRHLSKGNFKLAVSLIKQLQLCGFASAKQVPRRVSTLEELHLSALQPLFDSVLDSINTSLQASDDVCLQDDIIQHNQVLQHEAGHFLVGYLLGVLPKHYKFSFTQDVKQDQVSDASVKFVGFEFLTELEDSKKNIHKRKPGHRGNKRKLSSTVLRKFACVILGGLVAEHLVFGYSKGHHADVEKLDRVLNWLEFSKDEANALIRWAVLNTLLILLRHGEARSTLAEAMAHGRSVGTCIDMIETTLNGCKGGMGRGKVLNVGIGSGGGYGCYNGMCMEGGVPYGDADFPCWLGSGGGNDVITDSTAGGGVLVIGSSEHPLASLFVDGSLRSNGGSYVENIVNKYHGNDDWDQGPGGGSGGTVLECFAYM